MTTDLSDNDRQARPTTRALGALYRDRSGICWYDEQFGALAVRADRVCGVLAPRGEAVLGMACVTVERPGIRVLSEGRTRRNPQSRGMQVGISVEVGFTGWLDEVVCA